MQQISSPPQASAEVVVNENFETLDHMAVYGKAHATTSGLTWGYYGGRWGGIEVTAGTITLTANATNYLVVKRSDGTISVGAAAAWNSAAYARVYKVTTGASAVTAVEDHRAGIRGVHGPAPQALVIVCGDESSAITAGTGKATIRMPFAFTVAEVRASLATAQASGSVFTVDVNEGGTSILSTKLSIDNTEKTSTTAATPPVISDSALADDAEVTVDVDQIGDGTAEGLKVALIGWPA